MIIGVIPARFASSRLMGKPLAKIGSKPMLQHTYESALKSKLLDDVVIAVDDERVYDIARQFCSHVKMTPPDIATGSDRIAHVVKDMNSVKVVVNIQGDEPFIPGKMIDQAVEPLLFDHSVEVATLAKRITKVDELTSSATVKVVFDYQNLALYFSRSPIPHVRDAKTNLEKIKKNDIYKHIGLYVYRKEALLRFTKLKPTDLEMMEKLEQLRMLEHGFKIKIVVTEFESLSVDTVEDLQKARNYFEKYIDSGM